jgi:hypothetical protein
MTKLKAGFCLATLIAMTAQASAAALCDPGAAAALKTAAVQQELMVAGLTCGDVSAYNRFVLDYRPGLQKSDAALMAYFRDRDGNEAGYDSYKTKLANLAAGKSGANTARYCASAGREFAAAAAKGQTLENFVSTDRLLFAAPEACAIKYDVVDVAVAGVPSHELPAAPFGTPDSASAPAPVSSYRPPTTRAPDPDRNQAYNDLPLPPRYARSRPEQDRDGYAYGDDAYYGRDAYASGDYGPPPSGSYQGWLPRPRRWSWTSAYNGN